MAKDEPKYEPPKTPERTRTPLERQLDKEGFDAIFGFTGRRPLPKDYLISTD